MSLEASNRDTKASRVPRLFDGPLQTEAIRDFLLQHTHQDIAIMYSEGMEVQVNVNKGDGQRVDAGNFKERTWIEYTNGPETWKPFRIPLNASAEAHYKPKPMKFSLERHAEGIGMTGWNWQEKKSHWVAFDFDAMTGHSESHTKKMTNEELRQLQDVVSNIPFVTVRRSTSGKGLHLYIRLPGVPTENHTEHAALARAILAMLMGLTGYDFQNRVDTCGGNMWVWHRKMYSDYKNGVKNNGLELVKYGETLQNVPTNWRDYLAVVTRKRSKASVSGVGDMTKFEELTDRRSKVGLDEKHMELMNWLASNNCVWWWVDDRGMMVTHTLHLQDAHAALKMKGTFKTISQGKERGLDHNCFCFPMRDGSWAIRRFTPGTAEDRSWQQDGKGWTRCFLNRIPDLATLSLIHGGSELEKGGFQFREADSAQKVLLALGIDVTIPIFLSSRQAILKPNRTLQNKIILKIKAENSDNGQHMGGWTEEKNYWVKVVTAVVELEAEEDKENDYDDVIRHVVSPLGDAGWTVKHGSSWTGEPLQHVKHALAAFGHSGNEANQVTGTLVMKPWHLVNAPFKDEYPGNRQWNRDSVQLAVLPSIDTDHLSYPTWMKILEHCGEGLDVAINENEWCRQNGITKGSEYLMLWIASLFKQPEVPTTYLAFWGPQDSGKSIFHEAISQILLTKGVVRADTALKNPSGFNAELANAILCVIEETDLSENKGAYNRIKDWVTSPMIESHRKGSTPFMTPNYTHWIQTSNEEEACPVFPGDTRVTLAYVKSLTTEQMIPKKRMMELLKKEAADFVAALLQIDLPESDSRLSIPTIETQTKARAIEKNMNLLDLFIHEKVKRVAGHSVTSEEFYQAMQKWLETASKQEKDKWSKQRIGRLLSSEFPKGRIGSNQAQQYGNISFDLEAQPMSFRYAAGVGHFLIQEPIK